MWETPTVELLIDVVEDFFSQLLERSSRLGEPTSGAREAAA